MQPGAHVTADRRVGEVDLEDADALARVAVHERKVDLDRRDAEGRAIFVAEALVGVQMGETGDGLTAGRAEGIVIDGPSRPRAVAGEHNPPRQVPEPEPEHVVPSHDALSEKEQGEALGLIHAAAQRLAVEDGLDGRPGDERRLGAPFGQTAPVGLGAEALGEDDAERRHGHKRGSGVHGKQTQRRLGRTDGGLHTYDIRPLAADS